MLKEFENWYKKYIKYGNQKAEEFIEITKEKLKTQQSDLDKMIGFRIGSMTIPSDLDEKINKKSEEVVNLEENITKIEEIRKEINSNNSNQSAEKVFRKLTDHPKVEKIEVNDKELYITTKNLKVRGESIGHFKFTYSLDNRLHIRNLEYVVSGRFDHWHVSYGDPCLSEWKAILWRYLDTFQLFMFVDTLIHYLLLSNSEHAYIPFEEWIKKFKAKEPLEQQSVPRSNLSDNQQAYLQDYPSDSIILDNSNAATGAGWSGVGYTTTTVNTWTYWSSGTSA